MEMVAVALEMEREKSFAQAKTKRLPTDTKPQPFTTQIPLVDVFERLKYLKADAWQRDFCNRLQAATENRHIEGVRALIHAQPQLGKSVILAQVFAAWLFGHDALHRFALATYNIKRSARHAKVVIRIMQSNEYKDLFPNPNSHLPSIVSVDNITTNARREMNDGQVSFNPLGLQTGFVGTGADTLAVDDPYKSAEEATSETIRENIEVFWDETANVRITEYANVFGMFHRYHQADLAGYLLATGEFDYWRYASEADGAFIDDETGLSYPDPLERVIGEYISPRFSNDYYERQKRNPKTWYSQFQGKPTGEEGTTFNIKKIRFLDPIADYEELQALRRKMVHWSRAWDNAATKKETSAYTCGVRGGISLDEEVLIDDIVRERLNTAERYERQLETAEDDGFLVPVLIPNDPGSAGTDTAFQTVRMLEEERYTAIAETVSGSKEARAQPLSLAVNSGKVTVALSPDKTKEFKKEFKNFPLSAFKDQVDAASDMYRFNYKLLKSGTVIKNYSETRNLVNWNAFAQKFGPTLPKNWRLYFGCRISEDARSPSGAVLVAHAAQNSGLQDTLFIVDEYKHLSGDYYKIFDWIKEAITIYTPQFPPQIYLRTKSESISTTARAKLNMNIMLFDHEITRGLPELNWFFLPRQETNPFNEGEPASGIYYLIRKEDDLLAARQESLLWKYNDKGEPQEFGGIVMDAVRIVASGFRTRATELTDDEEYRKYIEVAAPNTLPENIVKIQDPVEQSLAISSEQYNRWMWDEQNAKADYIPDPYNDWLRAKENAEDDFGWR